jgi:hypothetical protein
MGNLTMPPLVAEPPAPAQKKEPSEAFRFVRGQHDKILEYQFGIARWLMASLLLINGGGLVAIMDAPGDMWAAARWFAAGVILAITSGTLSWVNCNLITLAADYRTDWENLEYRDSAKAAFWDFWALGFAIFAVVAAVGALVSFTGGALSAASEIRAAKLATPQTASQSAGQKRDTLIGSRPHTTPAQVPTPPQRQ